VALRDIFGFYYVLLSSFIILIVVILDGSRNWYFALPNLKGKTPAADFPGKLLCCVLAFTVFQHLKVSGVGILCVRDQMSVNS
jgi:hypothetical protein